MRRNMLLHLMVALMMVLVFTPFSYAADYSPLPDTGQKTCYNVTGDVIECRVEGQPLHGQDAQYIGQAPAYRYHTNDTVTDLNTGLIWMQSTADINIDGTIDPQNDTITWQEAIEYCSGLSFANHDDWRLPTIIEFQSIVHYKQYNHRAIHPVFTCKPNNYWSATEHAYDLNWAWVVDFTYGRITWNPYFMPQYVRCVRSGL